MPAPADLANPPRRVPDLALPSVARPGATARLRERGRRAPILVLLHGLRCAGCAAYLRRLAAQLPGLVEWDGRPLLILGEAPGADDGAARGVTSTFEAVVDPERRAATALSVEAPAIVVADQWGEIHLAAEAGAEHRFPAPEELVEWARYLAVRCPECEGEAR